ncbi:hypothetical protein N4G70_36515 [Streptomyces sp. ASQP_92]|uniref:hypothetical protein n=1 Tax=Streptomyces sp. ASQP_92 TaxID=2979116 RepID=UPI0021BFC5F5|nr:hypothetical protein [Streptomyces sp. ASQP_92]MCT9094301.1 hypothetical protein [Streptomyces sp. ASQP_92]
MLAEQPSGSYDGFSIPAASTDGSLVYVAHRTEDTTGSGQRLVILTLPVVWAVDAVSGASRWKHVPSESFTVSARSGRLYVATPAWARAVGHEDP